MGQGAEIRHAYSLFLQCNTICYCLAFTGKASLFFCRERDLFGSNRQFKSQGKDLLLKFAHPVKPAKIIKSLGLEAVVTTDVKRGRSALCATDTRGGGEAVTDDT